MSKPVVTTESACTADMADLYSGGGEYVGTLPDLGAPCDLLDALVPETGAGDEATYSAAVSRLVKRNGVTTWPHLHADSQGTPWAYRWAGNAVQVYRLGRLYAVLYPSHGRPRSRSARSSPFPRMLPEVGSESSRVTGDTVTR